LIGAWTLTSGLTGGGGAAFVRTGACGLRRSVASHPA
jgi:hypothetical protein